MKTGSCAVDINVHDRVTITSLLFQVHFISLSLFKWILKSIKRSWQNALNLNKGEMFNYVPPSIFSTRKVIKRKCDQMNDTERYFFCCRENLKSNHIFNLKIKFTLKKNGWTLRICDLHSNKCQLLLSWICNNCAETDEANF